jgi:hypothetical protein
MTTTISGKGIGGGAKIITNDAEVITYLDGILNDTSQRGVSRIPDGTYYADTPAVAEVERIVAQ